jgi:hypothetical protein
MNQLLGYQEAFAEITPWSEWIRRHMNDIEIDSDQQWIAPLAIGGNLSATLFPKYITEMPKRLEKGLVG